MQIGLFGLGRMGANMARRWKRDGHDIIVCNRSKGPIDELMAEGLSGVYTIEELIAALKPPRAIWVMISSGAPTAAYFVAREVQKGAGIFWQECSSRKFINMWRFWNQVNTFYIAAILRGVTGKGLTTDKVFQSTTQLHIGVADFKTGAPRLLYPQTGEDLLMAIQASILMPNVSNDIVTFDDIRYVDGGFTRPHILRTAIDSIEATHVLIMTNQDQTVSTIPRLERFLNQTIFRMRMPAALRFAAHERRRERMKALEYMSAHYPKPYALVWGDHSIMSMERDATKIRAVTEKSRRWWRALLNG